jgi:hypothetical protein
VTTSQLHPSVGVAIVKITGGNVALDALSVPYATAQIEIPWSGPIGEVDPRDDIRIIISAGNSGHWELVPDGYGDGGYGHGPYGHTEGA